jgi:ABC-2 type transport system permease protein
LSPLVPQLKDLIREYEVAGDGGVRVELIDPQSEPELEKEANQKFGIKPVPFQVADRYQSSIVSSYFNVLVQYGDQHKVLGFRDLIEVKTHGEADIDVQLRNPEHDITRAIKTVLNEFQSSGNLFSTVSGNIDFTLYASQKEQLPEQLQQFKTEVLTTLESTSQQANGQFTFDVVDPEADDGRVAVEIAENYGFQPMSANLFSEQSFYFYMTLQKDDQVVQIPLADLTQQSFEQNLEAGIKRFASGFTKTVALVVPEQRPTYSPYGSQGTSFNQLEAFLNEELNVVREDLSDGSVSGEADLLMLVAPENLSEKEVFAIDQFLMKGGTIIAATSPYQSNMTQRSFTLQKHSSGLSNWFAHHGITIDEQVILDQQNSAFPIPVTRNVSGYQIQEMRMFDYPFFADIRGEGINQENLVTSELPQVTMTWASPLSIEPNQERQTIELLKTSANSWVSNDLDIAPKLDGSPHSGFQARGEQNSYLVGGLSEGVFESFFADKPSPIFDSADNNSEGVIDGANDKQSEEEKTTDFQVSSVIKHSPESARIIVFSSNDFLSDNVLRLVGSAQQSEYLNSVQMVANAVDWSLEDSGLLSIRSRGHFNRTLPPMEQSTQVFWEYLNYGLALIALGIIALVVTQQRYRKHKQFVELYVK